MKVNTIFMIYEPQSPDKYIISVVVGYCHHDYYTRSVASSYLCIHFLDDCYCCTFSKQPESKVYNLFKELLLFTLMFWLICKSRYKHKYYGGVSLPDEKSRTVRENHFNFIAQFLMSNFIKCKQNGLRQYACVGTQTFV